MTRRLILIVAAASFAALVLAALALGYLLFAKPPERITVTITNAGAEPLRAAAVHIRWASYDIGDVAPGASVSVEVTPVTETGLELSLSGGRRLDLGGYMEGGYAGTFAAWVTSTEVVRVDNKVTIGSSY